MRIATVVLGLLVIGCSRHVQASPDASLDAAPVTKSAAVATIDPPRSKKTSEGVSVIFVGATGIRDTPAIKGPDGKGGVVMVFQVTNEGDAELPITGQMSTQATDPAGIAGTLDDSPKNTKQCLGIAPPHGKFVCSLFYHFDDAPKELNVRVEGAWFHIAVDWKDAG